MSEKHTPGPWELSTVSTQVGICHKIGPFPWKDGKQNHACIYADYASNGPLDEELLANARLIHAAPDLLKSLKILTENIEQAFPGLATLDPLINARAAIAKATE